MRPAASWQKTKPPGNLLLSSAVLTSTLTFRPHALPTAAIMSDIKAHYSTRSGGRLMALQVLAEPAPLQADSDGVIRVGNTRVTLATIVSAFHQGATAETIVQQYPSLSLAEVYAVIGYYLRHQDEVDAYLAEQQQEADEIRQQNEARFNPAGIRSRLLARRSA